MANRRRLSKREIKKSLEAHYGNVSASARALGTTPEWLRRRVQKDPDLQEIRDKGREDVVDIAQQQIVRQMTELNDGVGDVRATMFVLERWGKDRGWLKREELTGKDGSPLLDLPSDVRQRLAEQGLDDADVLNGLISELIRQVRDEN